MKKRTFLEMQMDVLKACRTITYKSEIHRKVGVNFKSLRTILNGLLDKGLIEEDSTVYFVTRGSKPKQLFKVTDKGVQILDLWNKFISKYGDVIHKKQTMPNLQRSRMLVK